MSIIRVDYGSIGGGYNLQINQTCPADFTFHCGFKPKQLAVSFSYQSGNKGALFYDVNQYEDKAFRSIIYNGTYINDIVDIADSMAAISFKSINDDGFTFTGFESTDNVRNVYYLAIG